MTRPRLDGQHASSFLKWVRAEECLDARETGVTVENVDAFVSRYKVRTRGGWDRSRLHELCVEEKSFLADVKMPAQAEVLGLNEQAYCRRHGTDVWLPPNTRDSSAIRTARLCWHGVHVFRYDAATIEASAEFYWNRWRITLDHLREILACRLDPWTLEPILDGWHETPRLVLPKAVLTPRTWPSDAYFRAIRQELIPAIRETWTAAPAVGREGSTRPPSVFGEDSSGSEDGGPR